MAQLPSFGAGGAPKQTVPRSDLGLLASAGVKNAEEQQMRHLHWMAPGVVDDDITEGMPATFLVRHRSEGRERRCDFEERPPRPATVTGVRRCDKGRVWEIVARDETTGQEHVFGVTIGFVDDKDAWIDDYEPKHYPRRKVFALIVGARPVQIDPRDLDGLTFNATHREGRLWEPSPWWGGA
jgi:hypothetical protein